MLIFILRVFSSTVLRFDYRHLHFGGRFKEKTASKISCKPPDLQRKIPQTKHTTAIIIISLLYLNKKSHNKLL